jgi:hypothetical protein
MAKNRRDIDSLSAAELSDYIHAIDVLRQRSATNPDDPAGYAFQAGLHNDFNIGPCEHRNDLFFPWHRAHLQYFEKLLQEADPPRTANVTIPYWDWIHAEPNSKFPPAFDEPGLFVEGRNTDLTTPLPADTLSIVTEERTWGGFGGFPPEHEGRDSGKLEFGPHNFMHPSFIGGPMARPAEAAEDPIYFSFHCFIDLMWAEWQRRNRMPPPSSPDSELRGFSSQPKSKVSDFQDTTVLDYVYEYSDKLRSAFGVDAPLPPPPPEPPELRTSEPLEPVFQQGVARAIRDAERLEYRVPAVSEGESAVVTVRVKNPTKGSYVLRAYLHPGDVPFDRDDPQFAERYFVGYAAAWESHGMPAGNAGEEAARAHPDHPPFLTAWFDVTKALASIPESSDRVLTLDWVPAPTPTGARVAVPELVDEVAVEEIALEVYG